MIARAIAALLLLFAAMSTVQARSSKPGAIVLIGGNTPHGLRVHDAKAGVTRIARDLAASPDVRALPGITIRAYPDGWPSDPHAFDDALTIIWYFDGLEHHPLLDAARRAAFERSMRKGVGLATFHQASTLPPAETAIDLVGWLGAARYGMVDRTTETVAFVPPRHPIGRGVEPFAYRDEFYPTLRFGRTPVTPILTGLLHVEAAPAAPPTQRTVAWAFDRPGGGRSFGFTGLHYLASLDQPELRKLLLNAILWTAGIEVPDNGVRSAPSAGK